MQSNFKAKHIKSAQEMLSQDLDMASRDLNHYKAVQKELLEERLKKPSLWQKITLFFGKYF